MHQKSSRQLQERFTSLAPAAVLDRAVYFFARQSGVYAAFPEKRGPTYVTLRGQGGEEIAIAAWASEGGTRVSGSSYLFDQQIVRFLDALPLAPPAPPAVALASETDAAAVLTAATAEAVVPAAPLTSAAPVTPAAPFTPAAPVIAAVPVAAAPTVKA